MVLLIISVAVGLLLIGIGFLLSEKNAPAMLSGYNKLSIKEKKQVSLNEYVLFFRKFHFVIGSLIIVFSILFYLLKLVDYIGFSLLAFSLPGYSFFIFRSQFYYPPQKRKPFLITFYIMIIINIAVGILMILPYKNAQVEIFDSHLKISGIYGVDIPIINIIDYSLSDQAPPIKLKTNGFAMSNLKKGWFKLEDGRKVKLLIDDMQGPFLHLKTNSEEEIILSLKSLDEVLLYQQLKVIKKLSPGITRASQSTTFHLG